MALREDLLWLATIIHEFHALHAHLRCQWLRPAFMFLRARLVWYMCCCHWSNAFDTVEYAHRWVLRNKSLCSLAEWAAHAFQRAKMEVGESSHHPFKTLCRTSWMRWSRHCSFAESRENATHRAKALNKDLNPQRVNAFEIAIRNFRLTMAWTTQVFQNLKSVLCVQMRRTRLKL
jgi:hypothetical protein